MCEAGYIGLHNEILWLPLNGCLLRSPQNKNVTPSSFDLCHISLLQQHNHSGGEDPEAWHYDGRGLHGGSQRHEDAAARQAGAALRRSHRDTTHLHHHGIHGKW